MKYSKKYSKLLNNKYTTIRRYSKGKVGKTIVETLNGTILHFAKIIKIERKTFIQISTELLLNDTGCNTRKQAFDLIQSFYKKPINPYKDKLYIYHLRRL